MDFLERSRQTRRLGKVVKSNSHCDYVVQVDDSHDVTAPPPPEAYGFGKIVAQEEGERQRAVGLKYNNQLVNQMFMKNGTRQNN
ncbi:MAG: hypothetical protein ACFB0C_09995, partial [Leptolyngbyaceae cyanobacterium]